MTAPDIIQFMFDVLIWGIRLSILIWNDAHLEFSHKSLNAYLRILVPLLYILNCYLYQFIFQHALLSWDIVLCYFWLCITLDHQCLFFLFNDGLFITMHPFRWLLRRILLTVRIDTSVKMLFSSITWRDVNSELDTLLAFFYIFCLLSKVSLSFSSRKRSQH